MCLGCSIGRLHAKQSIDHWLNSPKAHSHASTSSLSSRTMCTLAPARGAEIHSTRQNPTPSQLQRYSPLAVHPSLASTHSIATLAVQLVVFDKPKVDVNLHSSHHFISSFVYSHRLLYLFQNTYRATIDLLERVGKVANSLYAKVHCSFLSMLTYSL